MTEWNERIENEAARLAQEFTGIASRETVLLFMKQALDHFETAPVQTYVPLFAHRAARERLQALAQARGAIAKDVPEILYVCVHNAGRSQMAAVLTDWLGRGRVHVRSAGSAPSHEINPTVREAMAEIGLSLEQEFPKPLSDELVEAADVVITMGCGDACTIFPGKRYLDWELTDPAGQPIEVVRTVRDDIRARVEGLLAELGVLERSAGRE
ncbi:MAG: arsenate reductase ArsC [Chloroflexi bacterium]|nr:arsenate reductase ArsC [Chloroflexota bacterium]MDA1240946.1 arsenate reductase ArsC [Chloroflexota bacterium]